jgi:hypothetical protein
MYTWEGAVSNELESFAGIINLVDDENLFA